MQYTLIMNNVSYDLPKFTQAVKAKIEKLNVMGGDPKISDSVRFKALHEFIQECIGKDNAYEIFESDVLDEIDVNLIAVCFIEICRAYDKPVQEAQRKSRASDEDVKLALEILKNSGNIQQLEKFANKANRSGAQQMFHTV